jgi:hypothetical protein
MTGTKRSKFRKAERRRAVYQYARHTMGLSVDDARDATKNVRRFVGSFPDHVFPDTILQYLVKR